MISDHLLRYCKSYASAFLFGREVGEKDLFTQFQGYARPLVRDSDLPLGFRNVLGEGDRDAAADRGGLHGVCQDGDDRMLQLSRVALDHFGCGGISDDDLDLLRLR